MPFIMMTFQNPPTKSKILAPGSQGLRSKLNLHSKNGTDRFFTDRMSPRHWDKQSFKGIACSSNSVWKKAWLSGHAVLQVQASENLVRRVSSAISTEPIWLSCGYLGWFSPRFFSSPSTLTSSGWILIKLLLLKMHLKTERYDKEVRKKITWSFQKIN